jgi:hypothetical protein
VKITLPAPYAGHCVFCRTTKSLNDEHIISKAIRKRMPAVKQVATVAGDQLMHSGTALNLVIRNAVCTRCNGGWMSGLERSFIRTFGAQLSSPSQRHVDPLRQERVATWAIKIALLLQLYTSVAGQNPLGYFVPDSHLRWLWQHQKPPSPPPGARVWLSTLRDPQSMLAHFQPGSLAAEVNKPSAYFVTFTLGYLIFQVYGPEIVRTEDGTIREAPILNPPPTLSKTLTEIWPGRGQEAVWPTAQAVVAAAMPLLEDWPSQVLGISTVDV